LLRLLGCALLLVALSLAPPCADASGGVLDRGNGPEPSTLDAHRCQEVACGNVLRDLYEGLVAEGPDGALIPGMAERWEATPDGLAWTFHLRTGLRWSNGEPLQAWQIVASFRRAFAPSTSAPFAEQFDALRNAQAVQQGKLPLAALGVSAPDPYTIRFRLTRAAPLPRLLLLPIAYPVYLPAVIRYGAQHTRPGHLVSNGAYRLQAWTPQSTIALERNPDFRGGDVHLRAPIARVRYHVTEDAGSELKRYEAGDLDITETLPPQPLAGLRARFGSQLHVSPYLGAFWLGFNLTRPPFASTPADAQRAVALRQALSLAIDRDKLTRYITGFGEQPAFGIVPPTVSGYTPVPSRFAAMTQAQREVLAKRLYRDAGYSDANPLRVELRYNTSTLHRRLALAVAAMWRETLGVRAQLRNEEWKVFVQNRRQHTITQVFRGGWIADVDDARNFLAAFASDGPLNWIGYRDARFDALVTQADNTAAESQRNALLAQAEARLLASQPMIPLYFYTSKHLVKPTVHGFRANPLDHHASRFMTLDSAH
jgi:oligopeptide transport system substrate-binding protein